MLLWVLKPGYSMKLLCAALLLTMAASALADTPAQPPQRKDTSVIGRDGTAYVTRVVPVPHTVSGQAQAALARVGSDKQTHPSIAAQRRSVDAWQAGAAKAFRAIYPVQLEKSAIAGVPVRIVTPPSVPPDHQGYVLLNVHGGGFVVDSGSLTESIPMAALTQTRVVSVLYPLAPEHPFPAALDAAVAVYRELLKTYPAGHIVIYGTSAGAILTAEIAVALKQRHLPEPAALGIFSGLGDFSQPGDSASLFSLNGLSGYLAPPVSGKPMNPQYVGKTHPRDPVLSPVFADLSGLPPTLFITSTRDMLLSGTTILHRAFRRAGVDAQLIVFEALPHTFWNDPSLPESREAHRAMADFFSTHLYGSNARRLSALKQGEGN